MAAFTEASLSGTPGTLTMPGGTNWIGFTLPPDFNGALSLQIIALGGTSPVLILEVSNREIAPLTASPAGTLGTVYTGSQTQWTFTTAEWVAIQTTNAQSGAQLAGTVGMNAVGIYVAQALAYRNVRARFLSGTAPTSTIILGYGALL